MALFVSEQTPLFGFREIGYRTIIIEAIVAEALAVILLLALIVVRRRQSDTPSRRGGVNASHARLRATERSPSVARWLLTTCPWLSSSSRLPHAYAYPVSVSHVLIAFDGSKRARRALADGVATARSSGSRITVLALAATEKPARCCNLQTTFWNQEVRRLAQDSIGDARTLVDLEIDAHYVVREGSGRRAVAEAAVELGCDLIVEPGRRGRSRRRPISRQ